MTVTFFSSCYPRYLDYFYKKNPSLAAAPYTTQIEALINDHFSVWGSYTTHFRKLGVQADFIIPNCKPLQKAWAKENNVPFGKDWLFSIPLHQVKRNRPDIFFTGSMFEYFGAFLEEIRKMVPNVFGWVACEIPQGVPLNNLSLIISSLPYYVDKFKAQGIPSEWINAAFDKDILNKVDPVYEKDIDLSFIGSFTKAHANRVELVKRMLDKTPLSLYGTDVRLLYGERTFTERLFYRPLADTRLKGEAWGLDMFRVLCRSKITLNVHIDISKEYTGNIRMFEATGSGTLLLTDGKNAKNRLFNDNEVVYFDTIDEAIEKANYYLQHDEERERIAANGQKKTLSVYNYETNARKMLDLFQQYMKGEQIIKRNVIVNESH